MEFWKTIGGLIRRLYVALPVLMVAVAAAALASYLTPLQYQSTTFLVLTTPTSGGTLERDPSQPVGETNPLLQFNESLRTTAEVLIHSVNTKDAHRRLGVTEDGPAKLVVDDGRTNPDLLGSDGPFIYIEVTSPSAREAGDIVRRADQRIRDELVARQEALGAPPSTFISLTYVVAPTPAVAVIADKLEVGGIALVAALVLGLAVAYLIEQIRLGRRRPHAVFERAPEGPDDRREVAAELPDRQMAGQH